VTDDLLGPLSAVRTMGGIDPQQAVSLEAIGFGLDVVDMVYRRLAALLRSSLPPLPLAFADAWVIVDWMHRLDGLVEGCRGLSSRDEAVDDFRNASRLVENLRHIYQHPREELRSTAATRRSLWGHLAWQLEGKDGQEVIQITPFSRWEGGDFRLPAGAELPPRSPVDRVSLFSPDGEVEIGITGQWEVVVRFAYRLDAAVQASERPADGDIMKIQTWLPAPTGATYPDLANRLL
jgi:hypothetical protein